MNYCGLPRRQPGGDTRQGATNRQVLTSTTVGLRVVGWSGGGHLTSVGARIVELTDLPERIRNRVTVDPDSGCWVAGGAVTSDGYALVHWEGQCRLLHRVVWELANGQKIPKMHVLDHLREDRPVCPGPCRYRNCIHPDHL